MLASKLVRWSFLAASVGTYALACGLPALASKMGGPPMAGWECFATGLALFMFGVPLILWTPNLLVALLWFRILTGKTTERRGALTVPISAVLSTLGCCAVYPYRPLAGAWLWIAASAFAGLAAWKVPPPDGVTPGEARRG